MPIILPEVYRSYRVMSIDPGLNFTGVGIQDVDVATSIISAIQAFTLVNQRLEDCTGLDPESVSERTIKLWKLRDAIVTVLHRYKPIFVVCEAPFYDHRRPMAFGALLEVVNAIQMAVLIYNSNIRFVLLPPLVVKKFVGAQTIKNDTEKGKLEVKRAISAIPAIMNVLQNDIDTLSEHAIDAIAIGYTGIHTLQVKL